ncbi:MAG: hypothetical protein U0997_09425 [Sulfurimicrobium sp.]|nr:hypothetical protein [Sulfurimicrobium sp.]
MESFTYRDIGEKRNALEHDAATLLGRMLFEFGRLDMSVGLCLAWVGGGKQLESRTRKFEEAGFNAKLEALAADVESFMPKGSKRHSAYSNWIERAHKLREIRNQLAHGRWGFDAANGLAINIIGLPTSTTQIENHYTLGELESVVENLLSLTAELNQLRDRWSI